jgi:O-antigen biosynthesis protein
LPDARPDDPMLAVQAEELDAVLESLARTSSDAAMLKRVARLRQRELEQLRSSAIVSLTALRAQLELVERSSAWRYGHAASRTLGRLRGRRHTTEGGVAAALADLDRILDLIGARPVQPEVPADDDRSGAIESPTGRPATRGDQILFGRAIRDRLGPPPELREPAPSVSVVTVSRSQARSLRLLARLQETSYPAIEVIMVDNASPDGEVSAISAVPTTLPVTMERLETVESDAAAANRGAARATSELILFLGDEIGPTEPGWLHELVFSMCHGDAEIVAATLVDPGLAPLPAPAGNGGVSGGVDGGRAPLEARLGVEHPAIAVSSACLLISSSTFESLGTFDAGYQFGLEGVDLCLRARARGHSVACTGRAFLVHEGPISREPPWLEVPGARDATDRRRLRRLWGPALRRERVAGLLSGDPAWGAGPHLAIVVSRDRPPEGWEDRDVAQALGGAAAEMGWRTTDVVHEDETGSVPADLDVAVVLTDLVDVRDLPDSALVCAWIRDRPEQWLARPWIDRYDVLLAGSQSLAGRLTEVTGRPVEVFAPASDPKRFLPPPPGTERSLDWVFTGDRSAAPDAIAIAFSARRHERGAIYGGGWTDIKRLRHAVHDTIADDGLPGTYSRAKLVIDTATGSSPIDGGVGPGLLDALACGALVLTTRDLGARELFDDELPTWSTATELGQQLDSLLAAPGRRTELASRYRQTVLDNHTYGHRARHLRRIVREHNDRLSFCLKIGAPGPEQAQRSGDLHFATALGRALRRIGHRWRVDNRAEWDAAESSSFDVAIHLRGRAEYPPSPGQFNVLWLISHPETLSDAAAEAYDLVCVASEPFAATLRERIATPVRVLEQAADPRTFFHDPDPAFAHELVFVGNSRGVRRKILDDLLPTARDLAVWGGGWEGTAAERYVHGEHVANDELRKVYSSAAVVLCDHWPDMRASGFRSNRLYDALACDALVVSDRVAGLDDSLGDAVLTYDDPTELSPLLERLLQAPEERRRRTRGARERILSGETFDDRARQLVAWVRDELLEKTAVASLGS